jgi:ATP-dependent protease Clp ATPase subunit
VPVLDWPLAVCDATTVDEADLVDTDVIYPNYIAQNRMLHFNPKRK